MSEEKLIQDILAVPSESQAVEFKRLSGSKNEVGKIIETIVALANADGGFIVLGVNDPEDTKIKDIDRIFGIEENLENFDAIGRELQRIVPPLSALWPPKKIIVSENKTIVLLFVPKATDHFRSINNDVFVRQEKSNKQLSPQEVIKFAYAKGFEKADAELVEITFELLDTKQFEMWKNHRKIEEGDIKIVLEKTGLARKSTEGKLLPTRAAVLLFADYPSDLLDTKAALRVFQYAGTIETIRETLNLIGIPKTINGPIIKQISDAHEYVLTLLRSGVRVPSGFVTQYQIPERAVKEAITNAIIHRDYHTKRDIEVKIFEDRIEIESPGLFPYNITPANIGFVRADGFRNNLLVKHLREFPSPPNLDQNEGVRAMRHEMKAQHLYPPIFFTYPLLQDSVRVVLINEKIATEWEKVNHYLEKEKYITNEEARRITGIVQRDRMTKILKNWVKHGLIIQVVPPSKYVKGTKYRLPTAEEFRK